MELEKSVLALFIIGVATVIFVAYSFFPDKMLEVFSGSFLALLLFHENSVTKTWRKQK